MLFETLYKKDIVNELATNIRFTDALQFVFQLKAHVHVVCHPLFLYTSIWQ